METKGQPTLPVETDPREEIDKALADLPGSGDHDQDSELSDLWPKPPEAKGMSAEETVKFMRVGLRAHIVIRKLCMEHYGPKFKDWPEDARDVLNTLAIWGCHE